MMFTLTPGRMSLGMLVTRLLCVSMEGGRERAESGYMPGTPPHPPAIVAWGCGATAVPGGCVNAMNWGKWERDIWAWACCSC